MSNLNIVKALSVCVLLLAVAACSGASKRQTTYTNDAGAVTLLESDAESCKRTCNADFDRCTSTSAAEGPVGKGQFTGVFGAQADCKDDMRACLKRCK